MESRHGSIHREYEFLKTESMKIYYKSKLAKILTFLDGFTTMMFFGVVITEREKLSGRTMSHEGAHIKQYWDIVQLGFVISVIISFHASL